MPPSPPPPASLSPPARKRRAIVPSISPTDKGKEAAQQQSESCDACRRKRIVCVGRNDEGEAEGEEESCEWCGRNGGRCTFLLPYRKRIMKTGARIEAARKLFGGMESAVLGYERPTPEMGRSRSPPPSMRVRESSTVASTSAGRQSPEHSPSQTSISREKAARSPSPSLKERTAEFLLLSPPQDKARSPSPGLKGRTAEFLRLSPSHKDNDKARSPSPGGVKERTAAVFHQLLLPVQHARSAHRRASVSSSSSSPHSGGSNSGSSGSSPPTAATTISSLHSPSSPALSVSSTGTNHQLSKLLQKQGHDSLMFHLVSAALCEADLNVRPEIEARTLESLVRSWIAWGGPPPQDRWASPSSSSSGASGSKGGVDAGVFWEVRLASYCFLGGRHSNHPAILGEMAKEVPADMTGDLRRFGQMRSPVLRALHNRCMRIADESDLFRCLERAWRPLKEDCASSSPRSSSNAVAVDVLRDAFWMVVQLLRYHPFYCTLEIKQKWLRLAIGAYWNLHHREGGWRDEAEREHAWQLLMRLDIDIAIEKVDIPAISDEEVLVACATGPFPAQAYLSFTDSDSVPKVKTLAQHALLISATSMALQRMFLVAAKTLAMIPASAVSTAVLTNMLRCCKIWMTWRAASHQRIEVPAPPGKKKEEHPAKLWLGPFGMEPLKQVMEEEARTTVTLHLVFDLSRQEPSRLQKADAPSDVRRPAVRVANDCIDLLHQQLAHVSAYFEMSARQPNYLPPRILREHLGGMYAAHPEGLASFAHYILPPPARRGPDAQARVDTFKYLALFLRQWSWEGGYILLTLLRLEQQLKARCGIMPDTRSGETVSIPATSSDYTMGTASSHSWSTASRVSTSSSRMSYEFQPSPPANGHTIRL